jgi:hypothetical protein
MTTDKTTSGWQPRAGQWDEAAFEETSQRFGDVIAGASEPRAQAFALWAVAQDPTIDESRCIALGAQSNARPTTEHVVVARAALNGGHAGKPAKRVKKGGSRRKPALSGLEKAILAEFSDASRLVEDYRAAVSAVEQARAALEQARKALAAMDPTKARLLAQHDHEVEAVLAEVGVIAPAPSGPTFVQ